MLVAVAVVGGIHYYLIGSIVHQIQFQALSNVILAIVHWLNIGKSYQKILYVGVLEVVKKSGNVNIEVGGHLNPSFCQFLTFLFILMDQKHLENSFIVLP